MSELCCQSFFRVEPDDARFPDQWFLNEPLTEDGKEIDARNFVYLSLYRGLMPASIPIANPGKRLAFSFGAFNMPVVTREVAETIDEIAPADVQLLPVRVQGIDGEFAILNVIATSSSLDETHSVVTRWKLDDGRPDRVGSIHAISKLCIDPRRVEGHHIFRLKDWPLALLVSERLKDALRRVPELGVVFEPVS